MIFLLSLVLFSLSSIFPSLYNSSLQLSSWSTTGLRCTWVAEMSTRHRSVVVRWTHDRSLQHFYHSRLFPVCKSLFPSPRLLSSRLSISVFFFSLLRARTLSCTGVYVSSFLSSAIRSLSFSFSLPYTHALHAAPYRCKFFEPSSLNHETSTTNARDIYILCCEYCAMFIINVQSDCFHLNVIFFATCMVVMITKARRAKANDEEEFRTFRKPEVFSWSKR